MVKQLICFLLLLIGVQTNAAKYYFAAAGSNGNPGTISQPFQTLAKLNTVTLSPGDTAFINGGDYFDPLPVNQSGNSGAHIVYISYGTGQAHINGMASLTSWTNAGSNIWTSTLSAGGSENMVTMYGNQVAPGRYPNTGWQTISSYTGSNPITLTGNLPSSPSFVGGQVATKTREWVVNNGRITAHSGSTLTYYNTGFTPEQQSGFGYFIQHHPSALDQQYEWYYDSTNTLLKVYSTTSPASFNVRAATVTNLVYINKSYLDFINLSFEGSKSDLIAFGTGLTNIKFLNCGFYYAGRDAIRTIFVDNLTVQGCTFKWINNNGITCQIGSGFTIIDNTITQVGMTVGSVVGDNESGEGMQTSGIGVYIARNRLDSIGYCGITFGGRNVLIEYNHITNFTYTATDGGGIYSGGWATGDTNRIVQNNIVTDGRGERNGTPYGGGASARGMGGYNDEASRFTIWRNNTFARNNGAGYYGHKAADITLDSNIMYNNLESAIKWSQDFTGSAPGYGVQEVRHNVVKRNVHYSASGQLIYDFYTPSPDVLNLFFDTLNLNVLAKPSGTSNSISKLIAFTTPFYYSVPSFKSAYPAYEPGATSEPVRFGAGVVRLETNPSTTARTVRFDTGHFDIRGVKYIDSIVIQPYRSALIASDTLNDRPAANAGSDQSINLPTSTATLTGSGTDADGTVVYLWAQISGTSATISSSTSGTTGITGLSTAGTRGFRLRVTDNYGAVAYDTVLIVVNALNIAPTANAGADAGVSVSFYTLTGSGSDVDGTIAGYSWTKVSGTGSTITSPTTSTTMITGMVPGVYVFRLTVTDNNGATGYDDVTITFTNTSPTANAGVDQVVNLGNVNLVGSGTDADGTIATYSWSLVSGSVGTTIETPMSGSTVVSGLLYGTYVFRLTVTDNNGATGTDDITVRFNTPPTVNAGSGGTITLPTSTYALAGSASDFDGFISNYTWSKLSGGTYAISNANIPTPTLSSLLQGTYVFRLTATDNNGGVSTSDITILVLPVPVIPTSNSFKIQGLLKIAEKP